MTEKVCIFCGKVNIAKSVEHIVSESLGNCQYVMPKGSICDNCNNKFSNFEDKALSNSILVMERARLGIQTKKGKPANGKVKGIKIKGNKNYKKNHVIVSGIKDLQQDFNPNNETFKLVIPSFDKSEISMSKLLLKIALESLFVSQKTIYDKYNFSKLKDYLLGILNNDWAFITLNKNTNYGNFKSIPKMYDKFLLGKIPCKLEFQELENQQILFKFTYGGISMMINLLEQQPNWVNPIIEFDSKVRIYPTHYHDKLLKNTTN